jgi:CRP-like cAMP-binding protein
MNEFETIKSTLEQRPLFEACSAAFIDSLAHKSRLHTYDKGQVLFLQQDDAERFFIVLDGWVKLFRETLDGAQAVVDILPAGHMFGETSIFENDLYPYGAEAAEPTKLISLPLKMLKQEIEDNAKLALAMLSAMARYRKQQDQELEHRTLQNASQRIGCFLLRLVDQEQDGLARIHLPYDKTLVASRLGMQPETFSRALSKLKSATNIDVKGATIDLEDLEQLVDYSCAMCSSEFPCKDLKAK